MRCTLKSNNIAHVAFNKLSYLSKLKDLSMASCFQFNAVTHGNMVPCMYNCTYLYLNIDICN